MTTGLTDQGSFDEFFFEHYPVLCRSLSAVCRSPFLAEELAQETMVRTLRRWDDIRDPKHYSYTVAFNLWRRTAKRSSREQLEPHAGANASEPNVASDLEEFVVTKLQLEQRLAALPQTQRDSLILVALLGFSSDEAAEVLGQSASSVRGRVRRGRRTLAAGETWTEDHV